MGNRSLKKYLYDVQQSIIPIYEYLGERRDFFEYERNKQLRRAVERELEIIRRSREPSVGFGREHSHRQCPKNRRFAQLRDSWL